MKRRISIGKCATALACALFLSVQMITTAMPVGAASTYIFTENFDNTKFPKAAQTWGANNSASDYSFIFTINKPMVEACKDGRKQIMMKNPDAGEASITYEFKEGFSSFEFIGFGGGQWGGVYGKTGIFKIQWSDSLSGTFRDFKQVVVGPNKGKTTTLANGEMTLDRPEQSSAGLAYFYSNKIPAAAKYLRLWYRASDAEGDMWYAGWMAAQVSLKVKAYGNDPHPTTTTTAKKPTTTKAPVVNGTTASTKVDSTQNAGTGSTDTTAATDTTDTTAPSQDDFDTPPTTTTTQKAVEAMSSSSANIKVDSAWKTVTVSKNTTLRDLAGALSIASGYEIKVVDAKSNPLTDANTKMEDGMLIRLYQNDKVVVTYTIATNGSAGMQPWLIAVIVVGALLVVAAALLVVFRKKIFSSHKA